MLPTRRVEARALEVLQTGKVRVVGDVEEADRGDEHVTLGFLAGREREAVDVTVVVPHRALHTRAEPEVRRQPEVADRLLQVAVDLGLAGVGARPVETLERKRVHVRVDVDLGAGILVVPPGAAHPRRALEDGEGLDSRLAQQDTGRDAPHPRADDRHRRRPCRSEQAPAAACAAHRLSSRSDASPVAPYPRAGDVAGPRAHSRRGSDYASI